ncbi:Uncharacterised protein [Actinobacillus pleuropneumoniae]|nr:Uncharacterised protein [Actinobacillus pleuropneumoniae]
MKRVLLLGDSIREGYEPYVRERLADRAEVVAPGENGRSRSIRCGASTSGSASWGSRISSTGTMGCGMCTARLRGLKH